MWTWPIVLNARLSNPAALTLLTILILKGLFPSQNMNKSYIVTQPLNFDLNFYPSIIDITKKNFCGNTVNVFTISVMWCLSFFFFLFKIYFLNKYKYLHFNCLLYIEYGMYGVYLTPCLHLSAYKNKRGVRDFTTNPPPPP